MINIGYLFAVLDSFIQHSPNFINVLNTPYAQINVSQKIPLFVYITAMRF